MMLKKLVNNPRIFLTVVAKRSLNIQSIDHNLGDRMKMLNDNKQYLQTLELIDKHINNIEKCSNWIIIQTLKACSELRDIQRGSNIHNLVSSRLKHDPYILPSLIHFYKNDYSQSDITIYLWLIKALSQIAIFSISQTFVKHIPNCYLRNNRIRNSLINMWGKTGSIDQAERIFNNISQFDHVGYTAMINAYGLNGMGMQAVELFRKMPKEFIDESAYVCVLNACSHSGLVDVARSIFNNISMKTDFIYTTMIDCLSRAAMFEEAQQLIDEFEYHHAPVWSMY
ncbi:unnamed protein product, partial [Rotaria sp. Silwood1]